MKSNFVVLTSALMALTAQLVPTAARGAQEVPTLSEVFLQAQLDARDAGWSDGRARFCSQSESDFLKDAASYDSRFSEANHGGIANIGVCWWHSRLQRAFIYLAVFRPDLPKPAPEETEALIARIADRRAVVEIGGYRNIAEFSADHGEELQAALEQWQIRSGTIGFSWVKGVIGPRQADSKKLKDVIDSIYDYFQESPRLHFFMLKWADRIDTHAFLLQGMTPAGSGYDLTVIDSNAPGSTIVIRYRNGDTSLSGYYGAIPSLDYESDFNGIDRAIWGYCGHGLRRSAAAQVTAVP